MNDAEYFTYQFYTWEYRGRGIDVSPYPVHLEAPFIPFFRHRAQHSFFDDGKKHTFLSRVAESVRGIPPVPNIESSELDYQTLEPFEYSAEEMLTALQVHFPKDRKMSIERMKAFLIMLSAYNPAIISFEIIGNDSAIIIQFVSIDSTIAVIETYMHAYFPDALLKYSDDELYPIIPYTGYASIHDLALQQEFFRPIQVSKNVALDPLLGVYAVLEALQADEKGIIQILFQSTCNTWAESIMQSVSMNDGTSFFINDPTAPKVAQDKIRSPLFAVTIRVIGCSEYIQTAAAVANELCRAVCINSKSEYNQLIPVSSTDYDFDTHVTDVCNRESHRLGMLLNADELITLLHFPSEAIVSKKLFPLTRKTVALPAIAKDKAFMLGINQHNGLTTPATVSLDDRIKHMHIIGATGTGKSTLVAHLVLQDIAQNLGAVVFDPHGDLIDDIIARIPIERIHDVILLDPSDVEFPIGLNILHAHSDIERELLSSDLVASFRRYATSWGDQMNTVFGNAIQALLEAPSNHTLHDLRRFLLEKEFRDRIVTTIPDPSIRYYWLKEFPILKSNSIGSILTRLDSFLRPKAIRNMVIQRKALDFARLFDTHKIILCKLSQGLIGVENSHVLGSLLLSKMHQTLFQRQQSHIRTPLFLYLDEFQNFITPSIIDMLSGIRKYNVGLVLSHQELKQLQRENGELLSSVLSNVNVRVIFRVGEPDARILQNSVSHFEAGHLQNLSRGEALLTIEQPQFDCSISTLPLYALSDEEKVINKEIVIAQTRAAYATSKADVERELFESLDFENKSHNKSTSSTHTQPAKASKPSVSDKEPISKERRTSPSKSEPTDELIIENASSTHRYLQMLIKKMAEARGYTATIEAQVPTTEGLVDILLSKQDITIAVEICNTTNAQWEIHNIQKCVAAQYTTVVSLSGDSKQLEKIKTLWLQHHNTNSDVRFLTPDALIELLDELIQQGTVQEQTMKGYRVNVSYDQDATSDATKKRSSIANIIINSIKKQQSKTK